MKDECERPLWDEFTRTIERARARAAETLDLEGKRLLKPVQRPRFPAHPISVPALAESYPHLYPLYSPSIPLVSPFYI